MSALETTALPDAVPELAPLTEFVADLPDTVDQELEARLFATMLDWSSALIAGIGHPYHRDYVSALLSPLETGPVRVAGVAGCHPLASAAGANAAISHFWEVDDAHRISTSHPGITVVPAVIGLAQAFPDGARERVRPALIAGFEAVMRVGSHLGSGHYAANHTTATAGCFGAAAAAARYLGLDRQRTLWAFGHAGTQAAGLWQILDDEAFSAKAFHAAAAVRNGLAAALLARAGIPGAVHVLEGARGMRNAWKLDGCDPQWLIPSGRPMLFDVTIKAWPTCGQTHSALDCARAIRGRLQQGAARVRSIVVDVPQAALAIAGVRNPSTVSDAKFSTSFCIAAAIAGRAPDFRGLGPELLADADVRALEQRTQVRHEPAFTARFPQERPARVSVELDDGTVLTEERSFRNGDPEQPWSEPDLIARTCDVLKLAGRSIDGNRLVDWARRFAGASGDWSPDELFDIAAGSANEQRNFP
ncbi:MmgE/PrpD family protein [Consotaella salsifontis]|uniref:2-methylcitrate dehydratase PrpD n=1 Tax=Consotaella salsifontis TaxID=1365950 RepID=A0A1T4TBW7_9HYPH|nr:MmgE/PrpD family protein [Consotaella salsifontis]SKA38005.1 2-methylcitrate dehydratase PrpD [Consotaella salsifontis]